MSEGVDGSFREQLMTNCHNSGACIRCYDVICMSCIGNPLRAAQTPVAVRPLTCAEEVERAVQLLHEGHKQHRIAHSQAAIRDALRAG